MPNFIPEHNVPLTLFKFYNTIYNKLKWSTLYACNSELRILFITWRCYVCLLNICLRLSYAFFIIYSVCLNYDYTNGVCYSFNELYALNVYLRFHVSPSIHIIINVTQFNNKNYVMFRVHLFNKKQINFVCVSYFRRSSILFL